MGFFGEDQSTGITNIKCAERMYRMAHPFSCPMARRATDQNAYNQYHRNYSNMNTLGGRGTKSKRRRTRTTNRRRRPKKTRRRGGGILDNIVTIRNVHYIDMLEKRLVNKCNDYDWVQQQRRASLRLTRDKSSYKWWYDIIYYAKIIIIIQIDRY